MSDPDKTKGYNSQPEYDNLVENLTIQELRILKKKKSGDLVAYRLKYARKYNTSIWSPEDFWKLPIDDYEEKKKIFEGYKKLQQQYLMINEEGIKSIRNMVAISKPIRRRISNFYADADEYKLYKNKEYSIIKEAEDDYEFEDDYELEDYEFEDVNRFQAEEIFKTASI